MQLLLFATHLLLVSEASEASEMSLFHDTLRLMCVPSERLRCSKLLLLPGFNILPSAAAAACEASVTVASAADAGATPLAAAAAAGAAGC
jgi:hypothetical protein